MIWILPHVTASDSSLSFNKVNDSMAFEALRVTKVLYRRTARVDLCKSIEHQTSNTILPRKEQACYPTRQPSSDSGEMMLSYLDK